MDGGHAAFLVAEEVTCILLPDELTYVDGALVACGFGAPACLLPPDQIGPCTVCVCVCGWHPLLPVEPVIPIIIPHCLGWLSSCTQLQGDFRASQASMSSTACPGKQPPYVGC